MSDPISRDALINEFKAQKDAWQPLPEHYKKGGE